MHEWALAEAVIESAIKIYKKENLKEINEIKIRIGELQQIEIEVFKFALHEIIKKEFPVLKDTNLKFEKEKAYLKCRLCSKEWELELNKLGDDEAESIHFIPEIAHIYIKCPGCESNDFEIIKGRGVYIDSIQGKSD